MAINDNPYLRDTEYLDPTFFIPDGLKEWEYDPNRNLVEYEDDGLGNDTDLVDEGTGSGAPDKLQVPDGFRIVSQKVRKLRDGSQVVDVVLYVDDVPGATKYELRVTKA